ncbi:MAG: YbhB/YbcL family Raf kinase inhibitor-like protein [Bacteroidetes bacterium]|nr:YbhB/YbcL family Raf kinase inhibitor-like protein [Bacteroidota bacterium]MBS1933706.1 YbhB/YbcL family Raf kinase inhibitor-like protein [Bacteroidota bacterium]
MTKETREINYLLLNVTSTAFNNNEAIPSKYTCDGKNINPPLSIEHIPLASKSLAIIVDDPDAPGGTWVHWVMWNIPVTHLIKENEAHGVQGLNDFSKHQYGGPCPPGGTHRYFFKIYALDCVLDIPASSKKENVEQAMSGHILAFGELTGLYSGR